MPGCSFDLESGLWSSGTRLVAGVDEAGRGPLAGPLVAAAVLFLKPKIFAGLDDSKKISPRTRERLFIEITSSCEVRFAVAVKDSAEVDRLNVLRATHEAMRETLLSLHGVEHALVDGLPVPGLPVPHDSVVGGDGRSFSIAAASVLAKVTRDRLMLEYDATYPAYGFARHKGYATREHLATLHKHGPCPIHRRSFAPVANEVPV